MSDGLCPDCIIEMQSKPITGDGECLTCNGRGGILEYDTDCDTDGYGVWATIVTRFIPCEDCIGADKCPGCGTPMDADQSVCAEFDIESFTCRVDACSWHYDADRFQHSDDPWGCDDWGNAYYGSADYGYW